MICVCVQCGGCWAFSVVSAIESVRVKDGGTFQELSVQQVIDCAYKSQGCNGGSTVSTLNWLKQVQASLKGAKILAPFIYSTAIFLYELKSTCIVKLFIRFITFDCVS